MVTIEFEEGRPLSVAPFKLGQLRRAAPFVDRINALVQDANKLRAEGQNPSLEAALDLLHNCVEVVAIGLVKVDPRYTAEFIEDELVDLSHLNSLQVAVFELLGQSGLAPSGEAKAPAEAEPETAGA